MTTTDTNVSQLIINVLTKQQYEGITTPSDNELYMVTDGALSSSDVTNALGYSPVKTVNNASPDSNGNVSLILPTVGNGNMVIKRNGTAIGTFTANQTAASTINISVPTSASDVGALPDSTVIGDANLVIQKNSTAIGTFTANATSAKTINISVPTTAADVGALPDNTFIPSVDQTYSATSTNAQSGTAVAGAISGLIKKTDLSIASGSTNYLEYNSSTGAFGAKVDGTVTASSTNLVTSGAVDNAINNAIVGGVTYKGAWTITTSTTTFSGITLPVKKGYMYYVTGTGPATVDSIEWNPGDYLLVNADVASGGSLSGKVEKIDNTESTDIVKTSATQTLTNKTIDADDNTIKDLTTSNLKSGVLQTTVRATSSASDTSIASEKAIAVALEGKQPTGNYTTYNGSSAVGSATQPIFINSSGVATATTYSLAKSVPSDAVFTDTTYTFSTGLTDTNGVVKVQDYSKLLKNTATGMNGLTIKGVASDSLKSINIGSSSSVNGLENIVIGYNSSVEGASSLDCVVIGESSSIGAPSAPVQGGVVIGAGSSVSSIGASAIGAYANANASYAIQLGHGTNATADSLSIGFSNKNYQLLDGNTGLIPDDRLSTAIARATDIANMATTNTAQTISETKTFTTQQKFQDGNASGCMIIGADVDTNTVTEGTRKLGRIVFHTQESNSINCAAFTTDTQYKISPSSSDPKLDLNCVEIGGRILDNTNTSPDRIGFTVAKVKNSVVYTDKLLVCDMDKDAVSFYAQPKYNGDNLVVESTLNKGLVADGSVQSDNAGYNRINYYNNLSFDVNKFTKHGNVVITDGVVSNFSTTNYLYTNETLPTTYNTFELYLGKYTFSSWANEWLLTNAVPIATGGVMVRPDTSASNAKIRLWLSSSSSSWDIASSVDGTIQHINDLNKTIELKLTFDGSKYTLYSNVADAGWQIEREITNSAKIAGGLPFYFGGIQNNVNHTIDLKAFKIIADGNLIFTGEQVGTATYNLNGVTTNIPYKVTPIGRIVDSAYRTGVNSVYSTYGYAPYYTIDTTNNNYTLPQGEVYGVTTMMAKQAVEDSK